MMFNCRPKRIKFPKCRVLLGMLDDYRSSEAHQNECKLALQQNAYLLTPRSWSHFCQQYVKYEVKPSLFNKL